MFMKPARIFLSVIVFCLAACAGKPPLENNNVEDSVTATVSLPANDSFPAGKIISVVCRNDASQSYALYLPVKAANKKPSIMYFFDPHADGGLPLKNYKDLADKYNF